MKKKKPEFDILWNKIYELQKRIKKLEAENVDLRKAVK
jgi:hypothetical protein